MQVHIQNLPKVIDKFVKMKKKYYFSKRENKNVLSKMHHYRNNLVKKN